MCAFDSSLGPNILIVHFSLILSSCSKTSPKASGFHTNADLPHCSHWVVGNINPTLSEQSLKPSRDVVQTCSFSPFSTTSSASTYLQLYRWFDTWGRHKLRKPETFCLFSTLKTDCKHKRLYTTFDRFQVQR